MVRIRPSSRMTTPFPVRSVPSIDAVNASSGTSARSATTALSAAERSKSTSPARGWSSRGNAHSSFAVIEMATVYGSDDNGYQLNLAQPSAAAACTSPVQLPEVTRGARERSSHRGADDVPLRFHGAQRRVFPDLGRHLTGDTTPEAFESEADDYAFAMLKRHGQSPQAFADLMRRLRLQLHAKEESGSLLQYLSTHPATEERIQR